LLDSPEGLVQEFRDAQNEAAFPLREGDYCKQCSYFRGLCPAGSGVADVIHPSAINGDDLAGDEARVS
jgi:hypothetical protein